MQDTMGRSQGSFLRYFVKFQKRLKESLDELKAEKEKEEMIARSKNMKLAKPVINTRKSIDDIKENKVSGLNSTSLGFFKKIQPIQRNEGDRPSTTMKITRNETWEDEEEYLRTTFHPDVKWKVL
jgi:hypothetical protein